MAKSPESKNETYSAEETVKRRDDALRRMLNTPPKPHKPTKPKPKRKPAT